MAVIIEANSAQSQLPSHLNLTNILHIHWPQVEAHLGTNRMLLLSPKIEADEIWGSPPCGCLSGGAIKAPIKCLSKPLKRLSFLFLLHFHTTTHYPLYLLALHISSSACCPLTLATSAKSRCICSSSWSPAA